MRQPGPCEERGELDGHQREIGEGRNLGRQHSERIALHRVGALAPYSDEVPTTFLATVGHEDLAVTLTPAPAEAATVYLIDAVR